MDFYREQFIKNFNMEMCANDLMNLVEESKLKDYIISQFNENFTYEELYNLFSQEMNKEDLKDLLTEIGHDFVDLGNEIKINGKQLKILKDNFNVDFLDNNNTIELEQWTNGGVDMIFDLDLSNGNDLITELEDYRDNFDIDNEIDLYRQDKKYREDFTITESVNDFQEWVDFIKGIIEQLKESE